VVVTRYFFHVLSDGGKYRDEEGVTCASARDAEGHALFMAGEIYRLLDEECRRDERVAAISVQVTDEMGNEIIRAPIKLHKYWRH
jgi:hypothetical protein